jgi:hypothetical protein
MWSRQVIATVCREVRVGDRFVLLAGARISASPAGRSPSSRARAARLRQLPLSERPA